MRITPEELTRWNAALDELQWSDRRLASVMGMDARTVWGWRKGLSPIPLHAWRFIDTALSIKRAYDPFAPCPNWKTHGRGNPNHKARMDAQALQRFKDAGIL
jgi:hypothetical protein